METLGPGTGDICLTEKSAAEMWPWVFGEKCPLPILAKMVDSDTLAPMDYYNMMFILHQFMPEIKVAIFTWRGPLSTFPKEAPDLAVLLRGWD